MNKQLTVRQKQIYDWIYQYLENSGVPPTRAELSHAMGFKSPNAAEDHLKALSRKGVIELIPGSSRGIRIKEINLGIPLVGRVAAGYPILAVENIEHHYRIDPSMFTPKADYLLRVSGMSMKNIGILDQDLLAVKQTTNVKNGDIVVARLDDEVTVKRFKQNNNIVELIPENEDFKIIQVDLKKQPLSIEGLAVGIIRQGQF
ncbi:transcriptional repressor LexA [Ferrovum sp. PN-J185]|uniref:transcriptional repressor LexA n=1 Tax=Ferrovum sp. PN-J185 TaxID=1356306 RepID=UPI000794C0B9|nr:transcriptional repressor LexA [Ferrovum sp. PN-J185]KXW56805.1 LexA repressor [Ferrovum sp. PN-J185]MCC6067702.1 transcriptional repressor LexA [Ferrovum sp. PN-J185]MDE1891372.1 transcriptional repressor LexA [Betaproteobacteria bacterium]MDE2056102.1 transcriptional repressor LexA [Betaproteobacteria bacterium]